MQLGQRVAFISIVLLQNGQVLVVGLGSGLGPSCFFLRSFNEFIALTIIKRMNAIIMKLSIDIINEPILISTPNI